MSAPTLKERMNNAAGATSARRARAAQNWDGLLERTAEKEEALAMMAGMKESNGREHLNDILDRIRRESRVIREQVFFGEGEYTGAPKATPTPAKKIELT